MRKMKTAKPNLRDSQTVHRIKPFYPNVYDGPVNRKRFRAASCMGWATWKLNLKDWSQYYSTVFAEGSLYVE